MKRLLIQLLGGFPDFDSALEHVKAMEDTTAKNKLITEAVRHLFNVVDPDEVLKRDKESGRIMHKGRIVSEQQENLWKAEAHQIVTSSVWRVMNHEIRWILQKKMFDEARITDDVLWGKLLTFHNDAIRTVLKKLGE